jgi:hypothetical protein
MSIRTDRRFIVIRLIKFCICDTGNALLITSHRLPLASARIFARPFRFGPSLETLSYRPKATFGASGDRMS